MEKEQQVETPKYVPSTAEVRSIVSIHVKKNDRDFVFSLPAGTSYQECYEAFVEGSKKVQEMAHQAIEADKKAKEKSESENIDKDSNDGTEK